MKIDGFENWYTLSRNLNSPLSELTKTSTEIAKRISEKNLELIEDAAARLSSQIKRFSAIKNPEDFIHLQKECLNENITAAMETTHKIMQMTTENMQELSKIWGSTAENVTEKAVQKAQKFAHAQKEKLER